jgi:histidinol-phosphate aminotransferase
MINAHSVDKIWVPTLFAELGTATTDPDRVNLCGCENVTVSARAIKAICNPDPEWLRAHWLAQDVVLRRDLGEFHQVDADQVFLTSGAIGGIRYAFELFTRPGTRVGYMRPEWPGFRHYAEKARTQISDLTRPHFPFTFTPAGLVDFVRAADRQFVILSNPSAVTGHLWEPDEVAEVLAACPDTLFVIDEADAIYPRLSSAHLAATYRNGVWLGSFSKFYGLSGLRIGYVVTPREHAAAFDKMVNPAELASVAIVAAREAFHDTTFHDTTQRTVQDNLAKVTAAVADGPWQLVPGSRCFAAYLWADSSLEDPVDYLAARGIDLIGGRTFGLDRGGRLNLSDPAAVAALVAAAP